MVMLPFAGPSGGARSRADDGRDLVDNSGGKSPGQPACPHRLTGLVEHLGRPIFFDPSGRRRRWTRAGHFHRPDRIGAAGGGLCLDGDHRAGALAAAAWLRTAHAAALSRPGQPAVAWPDRAVRPQCQGLAAPRRARPAGATAHRRLLPELVRRNRALAGQAYRSARLAGADLAGDRPGRQSQDQRRSGDAPHHRQQHPSPAGAADGPECRQRRLFDRRHHRAVSRSGQAQGLHRRAQRLSRQI